MTLVYEDTPAPKAGDFLGRIFALVFSILPLLIVLAPRAAAFAVPAFALVFAIGFFAVHRSFLRFEKIVWAVPLAILALMGISSLWSIDAPGTMEQTLKTAPILLGGAFLFSFAQTLNQRHIDFMARLFPLMLILAGALCLIDLYGDGLMYYFFNGYEEKFSTSKPNRSIITLFLFSFLALPFLLRQQTFCTYRQAAMLFAILLAVTYRTDSQAAQLGLIAATLLYFFFPYSRAWAWKAVAAVLVVFLFAAPFIAQWMFHSLTSYVHEGSWLQTGYAANRMEIWDFISRRALERPFFGFGAEATRAIEDFDTAMIYHKRTHVLHPHNFILQLWIEFGIWGPVLAAGVLGVILRAIYRLKAIRARLVLPLFGAAILIAAITYGLWQGWWTGLMALLMVYAAVALRSGDFCAKSK